MALTLLAAFPFVWLARHFARHELAFSMIRFVYKLLSWIIGLKVTVKGAPSSARPLLLISNHTSYLDVLAYGSVLPVTFTPKSEIAHWPIIGTMCKLTDCVFIDRKATRTQENMKQLEASLKKANPVLLFPEGTTSDGKRILPLRSSFFNLAKMEGSDLKVTVQPALIAYTRLHGLPVDSKLRPIISWYGDMDLWSHVKVLFQSGPINAEIEFFPPLNPADFPDRKALAAACETTLSQAYQSMLTTR